MSGHTERGDFGDVYRDPGFSAGLARETYADYYRLRYPFDADVAGRPKRLSPLHGRLQEHGAVFGTKAGWERADFHEPGLPWRRSGRDEIAWGWAEPPWFTRVDEEARAVRERAGIIDLSSFGKISVEGPAALDVLQRVAANDVDRPVGSIVYSPFLDERGGCVADVTVTRLAADRFMVVTGAGYLASDLAWLRSHAQAGTGLSLRDVSDELATIGLWGPRARDILAAATRSDVSDVASPIRHAVWIEVGGAQVMASRISYAGELGWELSVAADRAVPVWDALWAAKGDVDLEPFGYRALNSLRMEKGYRYFGTDITMLDSPDEAGLGPFVRPEKGAFVGREAVVEGRRRSPQGPNRRLRTVLVGETPGFTPIFGGEAVRVDGAVIGRLRSVAYATSAARMVGYVYLRSELQEGARLEVDALGDRVPAVIAADVLVDPTGSRMRG